MKKNKNIVYYFKKILPYFKKHKSIVIMFLVASLLLSLISICYPILAGKVIDNITISKFEISIKYLIIILIIALIESIIDKYFVLLWVKLQNLLTADLRADITSSIFELEIEEINNHSSGVFIDRINRDPDTIFQSFNAVRQNVSKIITNVGILIYIFTLSWIIGLLLMTMQLSIYLIECAAAKKYIKNKKKTNKYYELKMGLVNEGIKGSIDIKTLGLKNSFKTKISHSLKKIFDLELFTYKEDTNYSFARDVLIQFSRCVLLVVGIALIKIDKFSLSNLIIIFAYREQLFDFVLYLAWSERRMKEFSLSAERIFEIIDNKKFKKEVFGNYNIEKMSGSIEFKNVKFGYEKNRKVFTDLNFKIAPNDTIGIVGKSGAGKSTIFNLLTKTFRKQSGKIMFDGIDINDLNEKSIRSNITIIPQLPYIFNMTIKENLTIVEPNASKEQLINVLKATELYDYVESLPKKMNTKLGEGGVNLSGGQRQRLAIARALLKRTEIILFDEATSALDNETQKNIQNAINNISSEYTMLIIAHRLSTIKDCNKIFVLDKGKIVGVGTHKELLKNNKIYQELYNIEIENK